MTQRTTPRPPERRRAEATTTARGDDRARSDDRGPKSTERTGPPRARRAPSPPRRRRSHRRRRRGRHDQDRPQRRPVGHLRPARHTDRRRPGGVLGDRQRERWHRRPPDRARHPRQRLRRADAPRELRGDVRRRATTGSSCSASRRLTAHRGDRRGAGRGRPDRDPAVVVLGLGRSDDRRERLRDLHQLLPRVDERRDLPRRSEDAPTWRSSPSQASTGRTARTVPRRPPRRSGSRSSTTARARWCPGADQTPVITELVNSGADIVWATMNPTTLAEIMGGAYAQGFAGTVVGQLADVQLPVARHRSRTGLRRAVDALHVHAALELGRRRRA